MILNGKQKNRFLAVCNRTGEERGKSCYNVQLRKANLKPVGKKFCGNSCVIQLTSDNSLVRTPSLVQTLNGTDEGLLVAEISLSCQ
jgi:hypothetical protein